MKKICNKCGVEKDVSLFYKRKNRGDKLAGYLHICKSCLLEDRKSERLTDPTIKSRENLRNRSNKKEYMRKYRLDNIDKLSDYIEDWKKENRESLIEKRKINYEVNKESIKKKNYQYTKDRKKIDPLYKLKLGIRALILVSFKNQFTIKSKRTIEILGCSFEEFYKHLESQFDDKMNWNNQGSYWHMDHIKPISLAENEKEVYELNHYTNFQPLYWEDNLKKGDKYQPR